VTIRLITTTTPCNHLCVNNHSRALNGFFSFTVC
jgi:hypothetical protein